MFSLYTAPWSLFGHRAELPIYMHTLTTLSPGLSLPFMSNPIRTAVVPDGVGVFEGGGGWAWPGKTEQRRPELQ